MNVSDFNQLDGFTRVLTLRYALTSCMKASDIYSRGALDRAEGIWDYLEENAPNEFNRVIAGMPGPQHRPTVAWLALQGFNVDGFFDPGYGPVDEALVNSET